MDFTLEITAYSLQYAAVLGKKWEQCADFSSEDDYKMLLAGVILSSEAE